MLVSPSPSEKNQDSRKQVKDIIQEKFFCINRCPKKMHYIKSVYHFPRKRK